MTDYNLGTARGTIEIAYKDNGTGKAKQDLDGLSKTADGTDVALGRVGRAATISGALIVGGLAVAANSAANFEQRLSAIEAVSGATAAEMDKISDKALQLGKDTAFSATESASAMEELIKAGLSVDEVLNGAADATVNLAAAGEIALPDAAMIASNAMNQFNLAAEDMVMVADSIAGAANASAIDVSDFGQSLSQVGAVANLVGLSFEDTAIAIAQMGNAGIKGSDAGTSLKSMLSRLQPTTKEQAELMRELGLVTADGSNAFYDQEGNLKSLRDVQETLAQSLAGMSAEQKQAALQTLFGSDAIRAAAVLADEGAAGYDKMSEAIGKVSAADVAATRMDNLKGTLEELKGTLETVGITLGQILIPYLRDLALKIQAALDWFLSLSPAMQENIVKGAALAGGLLLAIGALVKIQQATSAAITTFKALKIAMLASSAASTAMAGSAALLAGMSGATTGATLLTKGMNLLGKGLRAAALAVKAFSMALLTNPVFLIVAAIAAFIAALVLLYKKNETFRNAVNAAWAAIKSAIKAVGDWIMGTLWPMIQAAWDGIVAGAQALWSAISAVWNAIETTITTVWNVIYTVVSTYINLVKTVITTALNVIKAIWSAVWNTFGPLITAVWELIKAVVMLGIALITEYIQLGLAVMEAIWGTVWNAISAVAKAVWDGIVLVVTTAIDLVKAYIELGLNVMQAIWGTVWNAIQTVVTTVWNAISSVVSTVVNALVGIIQGPLNVIQNAMSTAWNAIKNGVSAAWEGVKSSVTTGVTNVMNEVGGLKDKVLGKFSDAISWLKNAGKDIIQGLIDGITSKITSLTNKLKGVTDLIPDWKGPERVDKVLLKPNGQWIMEGLEDSMDEGAQRVLRNLGRLTNEIPKALNPNVKPTVAQDLDGSFNSVIAGLSPDGNAEAVLAGWREVAERIEEQTQALERALERQSATALKLKRQGAS